MQHAFVETNFLFGVFRLPSERRPDALALWSRCKAGGIKLYLPYVCLQEAKNLISVNLPRRRWEDIQVFHRHCLDRGTVTWQFEEVSKLLEAATAEVNSTKARYKQDVNAFANDIGAGLLHGTNEVFDFLEAMVLDYELGFIDKLVLSTVLVKAADLNKNGERELYFLSTDSHLKPMDKKPKLQRYYTDAGLRFFQGFDIPDTAMRQAD